LILLGLVLALAASSGCVERRMTIRSNPPGAVVYIDDYEIGVTPVSTDFVYYGTRKMRLVKDGYETLTVLQPVPSPWYEVPPLDFFSENLTPGEIRDHRVLDFNLTPQIVVPTNELLGRAENLRQGSRVPQTPLPAVPSQPGAAGQPLPGPGLIAPPNY
jgi:hypothetical protein